MDVEYEGDIMEKQLYNLTTPQKSILLTEQFYNGSNINNIGGSIFFYEKLNFELLEKAINLVVKNNDSFQIRLQLDGTEMKQYFANYEPFSIELVDVNSKEDVSELAYNVLQKSFDIYKRLFVFKLFRFADGTGGYVINTHHIISDSWTLGISITEIARVYSSLIKNEEPDFSSVPSYINYISEEESYKKSVKFKKDKEYWDTVFETLPFSVSLPSRKQEDNQFSCLARRLEFTINKNEMDEINEFCKTHNISVYNFFMAIFSIYTGRVSNVNDFVIGTPILGRTNFKEKNTTGMFINVVPFRFDMRENLSFETFANNIAKSSLGMLRHQKYSNQFILEDLRSKDPSLPKLYNMII